MPTQHRQQMIEQGWAKPHHGHDKDAVAADAELKAADQALLDKAAEEAEAAEKVAAKALEEKRAARLARHNHELALRKIRKRKAPRDV